MRFAASETGWRRRSVRIGRSSNLPPAKDPFLRLESVWEHELHNMLRLDCRSTFAPGRHFAPPQPHGLSVVYIISPCIYTGIAVAKCWSQFPSSAQHLERLFPIFPELKQQPRHAGCTLDPWLFLPSQTSNQPTQQQTDLYTNTTTFARSPCPLSFARSLVS
jgi:hypothetical protein